MGDSRVLRNTLGPHFGGAWGTLDMFLVVWEGPGKRLEFQWILGPSPGPPKSRQQGLGRVECLSGGQADQHSQQDTRIPDTRIPNTILQIPGYQIPGYQDSRHQDTRIPDTRIPRYQPETCFFTAWWPLKGPADIYIYTEHSFLIRARNVPPAAFGCLFISNSRPEFEVYYSIL